MPSPNVPELRAAAVEALHDAEQYLCATDAGDGRYLLALAHMAEVCADPPDDGGASARALAALCRLHLATAGG